MDRRFIQMSLPSLDTEEDDDEEDTQSEEDKRGSTPVRKTSTEQMDESFDSTPLTPIGRGRPKLFKKHSPKSPGTSNLKIHVDKVSEQQLEQAIELINEDSAQSQLSTITVMKTK